MDFNEIPTQEVENEIILESLPVTETSNNSWFFDDNWFKNHPEKVLGEAYETSGKWGKVIMYKGTIDSVERIDVSLATPEFNLGENKPLQSEGNAYVQSAELINPINQEFIKKTIETSHKNAGKKAIDKKHKAVVEGDDIVFKDVELQTFQDVRRTYNEGITDDELEAYVWYKTQIGKPLSRQWVNLIHHNFYEDNLNETAKYNVEEDKISEWVNSGLLFYYENSLVPAVEYLSGNMYDKKMQLDRDKDEIIEKYSEDVYNKQVETFNTAWRSVYDKRLTIGQSENSLVILPISNLASEFKIGRLASFADDKGFKLIMVTASSNKYYGKPDWAKDATKTEYDRDRIEIESLSLLESFNYFLLKIRPELKLPITHLDIVNYYCYGKNITGGTKNMDEKEYKAAEAKKEKLKSNTQIEGERLFKIFLDTELETNDKIRLETEWNSNYNNFKQIDLNKVPVAFNMCLKYKGTFEKLLPEKREAVAFTMHTGSGILSYDVGVGKTPSAIFTMSAFLDAGYAKRICLTVPNQVYKQFISEIRSFAPHIPIIEGYNLSPEYLPNFQNSKGEMGNVPNGSITVLTYEGLERVGFNETTQNEMISGLYEILNQGGESERVVSEKKSAKKTATFYEKIETLVGKGLSGTLFNIEDFGFDFMCYDEAHKMKKVFTAVKVENETDERGKETRGRNPYQINSGVASNIALKGFMLNYYVQQKNKGGNVLMLTATPFTNSPLEIFSMLSMVAYEKLKDTNLNNIKTFFDTYVNCTTQLVINSRLKPQFKQVILGFNNLISLQTLIRRFINYKTGEEVKVPRPKKYVLPYITENIDGVVTRLGENERVETFIPMTPLQEIMMDSIIAYVEDKGEIDTANFSEDELVEQENEDEIDVDSLVYYLTVDKNGKQGRGKGIVAEIILEGNETKYKVKKADKEWGELDPIKIAGTFKENELELFVDEGSVDVDEDSLDSDEKAGVKIIKGLTYARNLALSPHLFVLSGLKKPDYKSYIEMSPKLKYVMMCAKSVRDYHIKHKEPVSGQVIYMDRGIKYFGLLKEYLIKECGFAEHEIGIIKSGLPKNGKRSKEYIKNLFNGEVYNEVSKLFDTVPDEDRIKVVIGSSTIKEGINLQKFGTVLYNCFIDWNPTDIQQLEGRIWRQGNEFKSVRVVNPLVIDSADIFIFQKLQEKTSRLNTIWATDGKRNVLNTEEFNPEELKYALIRDPKVIAELKSIEEKAKLESSQLGYGRQLEQIEKLKGYSYNITSNFEYLLKSISPYRDIEITGDRLVDASTITKAIIETEKSQKDKEGKKLASYSEKRPDKQYYESWTEFEKRKLEIPNYSKLDKYNKPTSYFSDFALAVREVNKMVTNFVNQYELTFSLDNFGGLDDFKLNIDKNIEANKERQIYFESDEFKKQVEEETIQERLANQLEYKPLQQTIFDFGKLNYLLSDKKVSSKFAVSYPSCPPMDANGVALIDKNAIAYLNKCIESQGQTKDLYFNQTSKTYTPERQALHDEIIGNLFKEVKCVKQGKPIAVFTGGSPASGKSYFVNKIATYLTDQSIFHLDADAIRAELLPEYQGWNASATHKETQDIVNSILEHIGEGSCRYDFLYDGTMNKAEKYFGLINKVKALGYETYIIFLDIPYAVAYNRSLQRYQNGFKNGKNGRYVPVQVIDDFFTIRPNSGGKTNGQYALDELKTIVDGYIVVDGLTGKVIDKKGDAFPRDRSYENATVVAAIENVNYADKSVDELIEIKNDKYSNMDIESPMSEDEKSLTKTIAAKFSDVNKKIAERRKLKNESKQTIEVHQPTKVESVANTKPNKVGSETEKGENNKNSVVERLKQTLPKEGEISGVTKIDILDNGNELSYGSKVLSTLISIKKMSLEDIKEEIEFEKKMVLKKKQDFSKFNENEVRNSFAFSGKEKADIIKFNKSLPLSIEKSEKIIIPFYEAHLGLNKVETKAAEPTQQQIKETIEGLMVLADMGDTDALETVEGLKLLLD